MTRRAVDERGDELLSLVGLSEERHRIKGYSRGMKQRLGIAQALLNDPKLLICDEPTSALDPIGRREFLDLLSSVCARTTVLFSTHILSDVERICTDVAFLSEGKIVRQGSIREIKSLCAPNEFLIKTESADGLALLLDAFFDAKRIAQDELILAGGDVQLRAAMSVIAQKEIPIVKIERVEPSLESVFLEVAK